MTRLQHIMVIDDDESILTVIEAILGHLDDYQLTLCRSGPIALALAPRVVPDVILIDNMMPELDGSATLAQLRTVPALRETPVIVLTARYDDQAMLAQPGVLGMIRKPFHPRTLAANIERLWSGRNVELGPSPQLDTEKLIATREHFLVQLRTACTALADGWAQAPSLLALRGVEAVAHRHAGTSATLGFHAISVTARKLNNLAAALLGEEPAVPSRVLASDDIQRVAYAITELTEVCQTHAVEQPTWQGETLARLDQE